MTTVIKDFLKALSLFSLVTILAYMLKSIGEAIDIIVVMYVLVVLIISRITNGYFWGIAASVSAVLFTNFIFTAPYFKINFTLSGYPITFAVMLVTSIMTSTLTSSYKKQKEAAESMAMQLQKSYAEQRIIERKAEKEKMKNNLLRAISHDLRTPLTGIKGASSALLEGGEKLSEETKIKLLTDIGNEAQWLIRMVENLLSVTHISEDTMKVNKTPEVAEEIIANAVSHFSAAGLSQKISVNVPHELLIVPMDAMLIEQVLLNLLDNAAKHSGSTEVNINLYPDADNAVFQVKDNGKGISEDDLEYLFEYGESKDKNLSPDSRRGFGIGLPTCRTIILAHSGEIWVESELGKGTLFSFSLPMENLPAERTDEDMFEGDADYEQ
ncbi:MAG: DUF4118 domain-containing protein [Bacillota bacterium]|nr:DUF4118 domain-containing protein [Bacillota bacterium]